MRSIVFALCLLGGFGPSTSFASQWVGCSNADFRIDFIVNSEATSISEFSFYVNDVIQDTKNWMIKKKTISFQDKRIELKAVLPSDMTGLHLRTKHKKGTLFVGGRGHKLTCDWSNWSL